MPDGKRSTWVLDLGPGLELSQYVRTAFLLPQIEDRFELLCEEEGRHLIAVGLLCS